MKVRRLNAGTYYGWKVPGCTGCAAAHRVSHEYKDGLRACVTTPHLLDGDEIEVEFVGIFQSIDLPDGREFCNVKPAG